MKVTLELLNELKNIYTLTINKYKSIHSSGAKKL